MGELQFLVVEDDRDHLQCVLALLRVIFPNVALDYATTLEEFKDCFQKINNFSILIVDGCLCSKNPNTPAVVREIIGTGFKGQIIGISNNEDNLAALQKAGCHQICLKVKFTSLEMINQIIGRALTKLGLSL